MARRTQPVALPKAALGAAAFVAALTVLPLIVVAMRAGGAFTLGPADIAAIRFTLFQAALSAALSLGFAIPLARALARRHFPGRGVLITLLGAPFIVPVIVAVLGLLAIYGRSGLAGSIAGAAGFEWAGIYGLTGVILAHVFFNLPLATRLLLHGWLDIPAERFRLAAALGMDGWDIFRTLEWPMLRAVVPGVAMLIFLICTTSFAVALALGGGPRATTVELAIYQAFVFEFDLGRAAALAVVQFAVTLGAAALALAVTRQSLFGAGLDRIVPRWDKGVPGLDALVVFLAAAFLILPMGAIAVRGIPNLITLPDVVVDAAMRSIGVATASAVLTVLLALALASGVQRFGGRAFEAIGYLGVAASPLVIGTGLFLIIFPFADPAALALPVTVAVNASLSLPFALRAVAPVLGTVEDRYGKLADGLGLSGWARWWWLILPRLRRPIGFSAGLAAAFSMGDLGVIALFADADAATLPLVLYRLMAAYRMEDAAGAALLLLFLALAAFWLCDRGGRADASV